MYLLAPGKTKKRSKRTSTSQMSECSQISVLWVAKDKEFLVIKCVPGISSPLWSQESVMFHFQKTSIKSLMETQKHKKLEVLGFASCNIQVAWFHIAEKTLTCTQNCIYTHIILESVIKSKVKKHFVLSHTTVSKNQVNFEFCRYGPKLSVGLDSSGVLANLTFTYAIGLHFFMSM